jgi:hypothetical protein
MAGSGRDSEIARNSDAANRTFCQSILRQASRGFCRPEGPYEAFLDIGCLSDKL